MNNGEELGSRVKKNAELYKGIANADLENYEVRSNATVIGDAASIDVDKIKSILDNHYNDAPKRKSIQIESPQIEKKPYENETKEYDLNLVLDKAKEEKENDYDDERSRKLHNTEYDILEGLNINREDYIEDYESDNNKELASLIDTIKVNENKNEDKDLFADLKADENTVALEGVSEEIKEVTHQLSSEDTQKIDTSFYTTKNSFKDKDFEEYEDFKELDEKGSSPFVKIIIAILIIIFLVGVVILVKSFK